MLNAEWIVILSFALIISMSGLIINFIKRDDKTNSPGLPTDKTLIYFRVFIPIALIASLFIYRIGFGSFSTSLLLFYVSIFLIIFGIILRLYTVYYLGKAFTVNIQTAEDQKLETNGPFRCIRHPSYTGLLLYYLGLGLLMHNFICLIILVLLPLMVVLIRIKEEEKMLLSTFKKEYKSYQEKTKMLIPFIF
jgi:protein-S-isoprenylcysteine O-methyltransferase Ste14